MDSLFLYGDLTIHITIKRGKYNVFTSKATLRDCMPIQIFINMGDLKAWLNKLWIESIAENINNNYTQLK